MEENLLLLKDWLEPQIIDTWLKKMCILIDINKYNNTCHSIIKIKLVNIRSSTYVDSSKEINNKDPKYKIGDIARISKYKNIFAKCFIPNWSEEIFCN